MVEANSKKEKLLKQYNMVSQKLLEEPDSPYLYDKLGNICVEMDKAGLNEYRREALISFEKAIQLEPNLEHVKSKIKRIFNKDELKSVKIPEKRIAFWKNPLSIFLYPLEKEGIFTIAGGALFFSFLSLVPIIGILFILIFIFPFICAYMVKILKHIADGGKNLPEWPSVSSSGRYFFQFIIPGIISFLPLILLILFRNKINFEYINGLILLSYFLGLIYYPMALIAASISDNSTEPLNFSLIFKSIFRIKKDYIICLGALYLVSILSGLAYNYLIILLPLIGIFIYWVLTLYFASVSMYILGNIYYINERKLNWFGEK